MTVAWYIGLDMALGLAIETSGRLGSVAIVRDGVAVGEEVFAHGLKHAAEIIPRIDQLLKSAGWRPQDLAELYVSIGPGSFTGLRIGITLAKTLAFTTGAKVIAVQTVEVLARNAPADAQDVIVVLDAKRDQIFTSRLQRETNMVPWQMVEPPHLDSLIRMLERAPRPVYLIGEGIPYHQKFLPPDDSSVIVASEDTWRARAAYVAAIGRAMAIEGDYTDPQLLRPVYLRKPEAEEKYDLREIEKNELRRT